MAYLRHQPCLDDVQRCGNRPRDAPCHGAHDCHLYILEFPLHRLLDTHLELLVHRKLDGVKGKVTEQEGVVALRERGREREGGERKGEEERERRERQGRTWWEKGEGREKGGERKKGERWKTGRERDR